MQKQVERKQKEQKESKFKLMFSSLKYRNFRLLWTGVIISNTGDFLELVALNWLVYELTGSAFYLGMFNLARSLPIVFFTLIAGALADKYERRKLLIYSQGTAMILSGILAILAFTGRINVYNLMSIGILQGVANSFNLPIRQSLIPELVPRDKIVNAVALTGMSITSTLVLGPSLGGLIVATLGIPYAMLTNALSFIAILWALYAMEIPRSEKKHEKSLFQSLKESTVYIINHKVILTAIFFSVLMLTIGLPYQTILPVFAKDVFKLEAKGYGFLFAASGFGALLGTILSGLREKEKIKNAMRLSFFGVGFFMIAFGLSALYFSHFIVLSVLLLIFIGFSMSTYNVTKNTILQLLVEDRYRGRVISTIFLGFGLGSLGSFIMGTLAQFFGAPGAYLIIGSFLVVASGFLIYFTRNSVMHA